jgi:hypothetical protein
MDSRGAIQTGYQCSEQVCQGYLSDLTDAELMVRAVPGINHIAWQLGHLIASEHSMLNGVFPDSMPALPAGFAEKHSKETAGNDNPKDFLTKAEYLKLANEQRQAATATLLKQSDADLDTPSPESMRAYAPTIGSLFSLIGSHWMMHAGQWAVVRRKQGRPPLF